MEKNGIKIEREIYERMMTRLRAKYEQEFGEDALSEEMVPMSRGAFIQTYRQNMQFWKRHLPDMELEKMTQLPPTTLLATHAICTNAIAALQKRIDAAGVKAEVEASI